MIDVITYALCKRLQSGIQSVEYTDGNLIFTLPDGSTTSTPLQLPSSNIQNIKINEEGSTLTIEFSDGTPAIQFSAQPDLQLRIDENGRLCVLLEDINNE